MEITTNPFQRLAVSFGKIKKDFWKITLYMVLYFLPLFLITAIFEFFTVFISPGDFFSNTLGLVLFVIGLLFFFLFMILYSLAYMIFFTKMIKSTFDNEKIIFKEILTYSMKNLWNITKTHWHGFWYVIKMPFLIIIVGAVIFIIGAALGNNIISLIGGGILGFGYILFIIFFISKGIRVSCIVLNAIEKDNFSKQEVFSNIECITGKWWKTLGNFLFAFFLIPLPYIIAIFLVDMFLYGNILYMVLSFILGILSVFLYIFSQAYYFQYYKEISSQK